MQLYPAKLQVSLTSNASINNSNNNENKNGSDTDIGSLDHASSSEPVSTSRNTSGNSMLQLFENLSSKDSYISSHRYSVSECCGGLTIDQVCIYCNIVRYLTTTCTFFEFNILSAFHL